MATLNVPIRRAAGLPELTFAVRAEQSNLQLELHRQFHLRGDVYTDDLPLAVLVGVLPLFSACRVWFPAGSFDARH